MNANQYAEHTDDEEEQRRMDEEADMEAEEEEQRRMDEEAGMEEESQEELEEEAHTTAIRMIQKVDMTTVMAFQRGTVKTHAHFQELCYNARNEYVWDVMADADMIVQRPRYHDMLCDELALLLEGPLLGEARRLHEGTVCPL